MHLSPHEPQKNYPRAHWKSHHTPRHRHSEPHNNVNSLKSPSLPSVYQLMRPVNSDTTPSESPRTHKAEMDGHKACLFCRGSMLIKPLVPFFFISKDKRLILAFLLWDMSWFVFLSFCPRPRIYYVRAPQVDTMRDSSCVKTFCLAFLASCVECFLYSVNKRRGSGSNPHTDIHPFSVDTYPVRGSQRAESYPSMYRARSSYTLNRSA